MAATSGIWRMALLAILVAGPGCNGPTDETDATGDSMDPGVDGWAADTLTDAVVPDTTFDAPDQGPQLPDGVCANVGGMCHGDVCQGPPLPCYHASYAEPGACCPKMQDLLTAAPGTLCDLNDLKETVELGTCSTTSECVISTVDLTKCDDGNPCTEDILTNGGNSCIHTASPDLTVALYPVLWDSRAYCFGGQPQFATFAWQFNFATFPTCNSNAECGQYLQEHSCGVVYGCFAANDICGYESWSGTKRCVGLGQTACPPPANTCQRAQCNQVPVDLGWSATCTTVPAPDGAMCDDANPATGPDLCKNGVCGP